MRAALLSGRLTRRLLWNLLPAMLVVGAVWGAVFGEEGLLARHALKQRLAAMEARVGEVEAENAALRRQVALLRTDPLAIRRAAAEQLLVAEAGSTIYRFAPGR